MEFFYFRVEEFFVYGGDEMAENLVAYGLRKPGRNATTVEDRLEHIENFITSYKANDDGYSELINQLHGILSEVKGREQQFYNTLQISDYTELNQKLLEIEKKYSCLLPDGAVMREVRRQFTFLGVTHASNTELSDAISTVLETFIDDKANEDELFEASLSTLRGGAKTDKKEFLDELIQKELRIDNLEGTSSKRFVTTRSGKKVGLGKIVVSFTPPNKKNKKGAIVKTSLDGVHISPAFRTKLEKELTNLYGKYNDTGNKIDALSIEPAAYRERINEIIEAKLKCSLSSLGLQLHQFDLNRSIASTIGYLGEIRATAILNELTPNGARGAGNLRDEITGHEIPIDVVCEANGFQIKNYTLDNKTVTFSNELKSMSWVRGRLQITGQLYDVLEELFGIYQYNQPIRATNKDDWLPERLDEYKEIYNKIGNRNNGLLYSLQDVYNSRIPFMLKMADTFSVNGDGVFGDRQLYFNTFFWINKYLVPASVMLERLIKQLSNKNLKKKMFSANYSFSEPVQDHMTYAHLGSRHRESGLPYSAYNMAQKIKAEYEITIDLTDFVNMK